MVDVRSSESEAASVLLSDWDVNAARGLLYPAADAAARGEQARGESRVTPVQGQRDLVLPGGSR